MKKTLLITLILLFYLHHSLFAQLDRYSMLDYSFGKKGKVTTNVDDNYYFYGSTIASVMLQKDGKIVAAGNSSSSSMDILLARYLPDGNVDSSFGKNGHMHYGHKNNPGFLDYLLQAKLQSDDKIVIVGYTSASQFLARFLTNGSIDSSFGINGKAPLHKTGYSIDIDKNDNIIVSENYEIQNILQIALQRFTKDGKPDSSFGNNSFSSILIGKQVYGPAKSAVHLNNNGKIVIGSTWTPDNSSTGKANIVIVQFNTNGTIDSSFNGVGKLVISALQKAIRLDDIAIQHDDKILISGSVNELSYDLTYKSFAGILSRISKNGSIDKSFANNGFATLSSSSTQSTYLRGSGLAAICIQHDNKL